MFGLDETTDSHSGVAQGIYTEAANKELYGRMHELAATILGAEHDVILDAAYLRFSDREHARKIAADCNAGLMFVQTHAPVNILRDRVHKRAGSSKEASEANLAVLEHQLENAEPLTRAEQRAVITWNNSENIGTEAFGERLRHCILQPTAV